MHSAGYFKLRVDTFVNKVVPNVTSRKCLGFFRLHIIIPPFPLQRIESESWLAARYVNVPENINSSVALYTLTYTAIGFFKPLGCFVKDVKHPSAQYTMNFTSCTLYADGLINYEAGACRGYQPPFTLALILSVCTPVIAELQPTAPSSYDVIIDIVDMFGGSNNFSLRINVRYGRSSFASLDARSSSDCCLLTLFKLRWLMEMIHRA